MNAHSQQVEDLDDNTPLDDVGILTENVMKLVEHPEDVFVEETRDARGVVLTIHVAQNDRGRVIGSHGANIGLLRDLMGIYAARQGKRINVEIAGSPRSRHRKRAS